jgi:hypothetical protein
MPSERRSAAKKTLTLKTSPSPRSSPKITSLGVTAAELKSMVSPRSDITTPRVKILDEDLDPLVRDVEASSASTLGSTRPSSATLQVAAASSEDAYTNEEFLTLHSELEHKERKANKSVYGTPEYRQAVDRARQRQKEREKALDRLRPSPKASPQASADAIAQEATKSGAVSKAEAKKIARQASADKKKEEAAAVAVRCAYTCCDRSQRGSRCVLCRAKRRLGKRSRKTAGDEPSAAQTMSPREAKAVADMQELCRQFVYNKASMSEEQIKAAHSAMEYLKQFEKATAAHAASAGNGSKSGTRKRKKSSGAIQGGILQQPITCSTTAMQVLAIGCFCIHMGPCCV